jgi:hypothetical protein
MECMRKAIRETAARVELKMKVKSAVRESRTARESSNLDGANPKQSLTKKEVTIQAERQHLPDLIKAKLGRTYITRENGTLIDGEMIMPVAPGSTILMHRDGETIKQYVGQFSEKPPELRSVFKELRRKANMKRDAIHQREVAAFVFEFTDGIRQTVKYTSGRFGTVENAELIKALTQAPLVQDFSRLKKIYTIHTHPSSAAVKSVRGPGSGGAIVYMSRPDMTFYRGMRSWLYEGQLKDLPIEAIVLPDCPSCSTTYISYDVPPVSR